MTAGEKAKELVGKFSLLVTTWDCYNDMPTASYIVLKDCKKCALIVVDEIISISVFDIRSLTYWQEVKTAIEKL